MTQECSAALIAGGAGRRLGGVEKGLLRLPGGDTCAQVLLSALNAVSDDLWINTNRPQAYSAVTAAFTARSGAAVRFVADAHGDRGAPGGVVSALEAAQHPWVLVVACDMPWVQQAMLQRLLAVPRDAFDVVCCSRAGDLEPLLGLYRAQLAARWAQLLVNDNPSLRALVASARAKVLEVGDLPDLKSLNTPEDLRAAAATLPALR